MDNPEKLAILGTHDTGQIKHQKHNTTQTTKMISNTDPTNNQRWTQVLTFPDSYKTYVLLIYLVHKFGKYNMKTHNSLYMTK